MRGRRRGRRACPRPRSRKDHNVSKELKEPVWRKKCFCWNVVEDVSRSQPVKKTGKCLDSCYKKISGCHVGDGLERKLGGCCK